MRGGALSYCSVPQGLVSIRRETVVSLGCPWTQMSRLGSFARREVGKAALGAGRGRQKTEPPVMRLEVPQLDFGQPSLPHSGAQAGTPPSSPAGLWVNHCLVWAFPSSDGHENFPSCSFLITEHLYTTHAFPCLLIHLLPRHPVFPAMSCFVETHILSPFSSLPALQLLPHLSTYLPPHP